MFLAKISTISANRLLIFSAMGFRSLLLHMSGSQFQGQSLVYPENDIIFLNASVRGSSQNNEK